MFLLQQFRAAWRRIRGKENSSVPVNETTVNQISDASSKAYIECTFTNFDKRKKSRHKEKKIQNTSLISLSQKNIKNINETIGINNSNNLLINSTKIPTQVFTSPSMVNNDIKYVEKRPYIFPKDVNRNQTNYELRLFSSEMNIYGKTFNKLLRADSYKSNIC